MHGKSNQESAKSATIGHPPGTQLSAFSAKRQRPRAPSGNHPVRKSSVAKARARKPQVKPAEAKEIPPPFTVVGIGASAGGLEAFTALLRHLPTDTGMAFVLVQHLDPTHESILTTLLSKTTVLPVREVKDNMPLQPNHVFVIPPNAKMTMSGDRLCLVEEGREAGGHHSIDCFLNSLARDRGALAIGVILSGSAFDGTLGLEAIKNEGGITFAQDDSAKYDSMPRSAIASGCVDFVLPPEKIALELGKISRLPHLAPLEAQSAGALPQESSNYKKVLQVLRIRTGVDFSQYKPATIQRRISRRMLLNNAPRLSAYLQFLRDHPAEVDALYQDVLINVTGFFRNPEAFESLRERAFPQIIRQRAPDQPVRVWVPGCSTGQEPYSIAMLFLEFAARAGSQIPLQVFGTDLNEALLEKARAGLYSKSQVQGLSPERLRRFFIQEDGGYRICKPIREVCVFAKHDLLADPPFSRMDLLSCRNVLIYLDPLLQKRLLPIFHYSLKPGGFLLLGSSETVLGFADLFSTEDKTHRLYSRNATASRFQVLLEPKRGPAERRRPPQKARPLDSELADDVGAQREADRALLAAYAPAGVLINEAAEVLQFRGHTGPYLEPPPGRASYTLFKMLHEGLLMPVRTAIQQAKKTEEPVRIQNVEYRHDHQARRTNLSIVPLKNLKERCFLVLFEPAPPPGAARRKAEPSQPRPALPPDLDEAQREIARLHNELTAVREYLQSVTEQYEAATEELQASNEEGQSSNEELQSINEELETAKEELQSTNEELTTVNEEMGSRNVELFRINSDLNNVLSGVQMCIVVLAGDLSIRRFTPLAEKVLNLVPTDVGRPITDIRPNLDFPDLEQALLDVLHAVRPREKEVQDKDGRWYSLRLLPYKTLDNKIDGVVLVLVDIDALKRSEQRFHAALDYAESMIETVREPLLVLDQSLRVERANRAFYRVFRSPPSEVQGRLIYEMADGQWNIPRLRTLLQEVLPKDAAFDDFEVERDFEQLGHRTMLLNGRPIARDGGKSVRLLLAIEDITERRQLEVVRDSEHRFRTLAEAMPQLVWTGFPDGSRDYFNSKWADFTGVPVEELLGMRWRETLHPQDRDRIQAQWSAALKGEVPYDLEYRIRHVDGSYHWFKVRATALRDGAGNIVKWLGTCTDIEDQKQIELELQRTRDDLEKRVQERTASLSESVQELEAFSYSVSHDLRSPLRAMLGFAELALHRGGDQLAPNVRDYLQRIVDGSKRADRLVCDLLNYSRISHTKIQLAPIDLEKLLRDVIQQNPGFQPPQAEVRIQSPLPRVLGHESSLAQCVTNLLCNAVKFVPPGALPRVEIRTQPVDGQVRIWFEDNGIGIEPVNQGRIFGIFERVHSPDQFEGTGIGLAIVRKNVERMQGSIGVESDLGIGSRFWIQLKGAEENE
jgi:two-component system CheB/CheR fusion protein